MHVSIVFDFKIANVDVTRDKLYSESQLLSELESLSDILNEEEGRTTRVTHTIFLCCVLSRYRVDVITYQCQSPVVRIFNFASHDFNRFLKIGITSKSHFAAWICLFYISTFEKEIYQPGVIGTLKLLRCKCNSKIRVSFFMPNVSSVQLSIVLASGIK